MPTYDYEIIETGEVIEIQHSIKDDAFTEIEHPETGEVVKVKRLIGGGSGTIFKGGGWTIGANRGYQGKFKNKLRPVGTPVDAPNNKAEADKMFQAQVDAGMLDGVPASMNLGTKSQTTEQQMDKNYNPYK